MPSGGNVSSARNGDGIHHEGTKSLPYFDCLDGDHSPLGREQQFVEPCYESGQQKPEVFVTYKARQCTLTFNPRTERLRLACTTSKGKEKVIFNVPLYAVLNIENLHERDARQRQRRANDDTTKMTFENQGGGVDLLCRGAGTIGEGSDALVYAHSRVNTLASTPGYNHSASGSTTSLVAKNGRSDDSAVRGSRKKHYSQHHIRDNSMSNYNAAPSPVIRAMGGAQGTSGLNHYYIHYVRLRKKEKGSIHTLEFISDQCAAFVAWLLRRIYVRGRKHLIIFISPKSGRGLGEHVFDKQIKPLLHFSRHSIEVRVTTRPHDCEDYIADLRNALDSSCVVAAAGGDGMAHEVANGLHRRKAAIIHALRAQAQMDELEKQQQQQHSHAASASPPAAQNVTVEAVSNTESDTTRKKPVTTSSRTIGDTTADATSVVTGTDGDTRLHDPFDGTSLHIHNSTQPTTSSSRFSTWDTVLPIAATIPTGSACGLAKSLGVLSATSAALALVHLYACHMDLLRMRFTPNQDMEDFQRGTLSIGKLRTLDHKFGAYCSERQRSRPNSGTNGRASPCRATPPEAAAAARVSKSASADRTTLSLSSSQAPLSPFAKDGKPHFSSAISMHIGAPDMSERVAFMSLSFGAANDIDHGSEHLRWMGNARFALYGGYAILKGLRAYRGMIRYLPWESKEGVRLEKIHSGDKMPADEEFLPCTMRDDCPHCLKYVPVDHLAEASAVLNKLNHARITSNGDSYDSSRRHNQQQQQSDLDRLAKLSDGAMLEEDEVDFDDPELPWVTIRGDFYSLLICNIRDVAQDMVMAPLAHLTDGAMDIVFARIDPATGKGGRKEFIQFFNALEKGTHVNYPFCNYVKARAVEVKVDGGISMSDGEMMPLSSVRMTKLRTSIQYVRSQ